MSRQLRAAIYVRMSTSRQADSPERQRASILPYCERKNYLVVKEYEDLAVRGDADRRPGFEQLLAGAKAGLFDVVVVDEASRLSRDDVLTYNALVAYPLRQTGVLLDTVSRGVVNWEDIGSIIVNTVQQHAASQEVVTLSRRVATTLDMRARKGSMYVGRPPLGYEYATDEKGERVGLRLGRPEDVQLVRDIFEDYVGRDLSLATLAAELTSRGAAPRGGKTWNRTSVHAILTNTVYTGEYAYGRVGRAKHYHVTSKGVKEVERDHNTKRGKKVTVRHEREDWIVLPNHHEPLIEPELFERAQRERLVPPVGETVEEQPRQVAHPGVAVGEGQRIAGDHPHHRHRGAQDERLHHRRQHVLLADHAGVEQRQPRHGHQQDQHGAGQDPGHVARHDMLHVREPPSSGAGGQQEAHQDGRVAHVTARAGNA
ncbi:recombinase family protein [bacterium]|nr:recombinase family protein [bacterium]